MMYSDKLVAVVKVNGRVLRESGGVVYIPFGSDYSIQLKNLHTTKARVGVSIDGQDVLNGCKLLVDPNDVTELEGFLQGSIVKSKFRFIEKTQEISDFRGDKIDDGLITITFEYERKMDYFQHHPYPIYRKCMDDGIKPPYEPYCNVNDNLLNTCFTSSEATLSRGISQVNDSGITVGGGDSNQHFNNGHFGMSDGEKHSIVIHLKGKTEDNNVIVTPIEVQTKIICTSCGRKWKSNIKFCSGCGTRLL